MDSVSQTTKGSYNPTQILKSKSDQSHMDDDTRDRDQKISLSEQYAQCLQIEQYL